jgi:hypothetical protein
MSKRPVWDDRDRATWNWRRPPRIFGIVIAPTDPSRPPKSAPIAFEVVVLIFLVILFMLDHRLSAPVSIKTKTRGRSHE